MSRHDSKQKAPLRGFRALQQDARVEKIRRQPHDPQRMKRKDLDRLFMTRAREAPSEAEPDQGPPLASEEVETNAIAVEVFGGGCWAVRPGSDVLILSRLPTQEARLGALVPGDEVRIEGEAEAMIRGVAARRSTLSRPDPGNPARELVIASNIDLVLVVAAAKDPPLRPRLLDRYLIAASYSGLPAVLCINKEDLLSPSERATLEDELAPYRALGVEVAWLSAQRGDGAAALRERMQGLRGVLVGHSGVGKSSLCNALLGESRREVGAIAKHGKGRHTTTASRLLWLPGGGQLIDTPGVREFGLWGVDAASLAAYFPEIASRVDACRFADCAHRAEPGCAVKAAVEAGDIPPTRYDSYLSLLNSF